MRTDWPLVGRTEELAAAESALDTGGVVLAGSEGVGKTRVAREVVARARNEWRETDWLAVTPGCASVPFATVLPLLEPGRVPGGHPLELLLGAADHMATRALRRPVVVGIDDAHLLDEASALVVHQLSVRGLISVAATVRIGEPLPEAVAALWKDGLAERVNVPPLGAAAMAELLAHSLSSHVETNTRLEIVQLAAGRPQVLRDLLAGARDDVALVRSAGVWRLGHPQAGAGHLDHAHGRRTDRALVPRLTPREREVALLAATGLPSRQIAERLSLSVRTVDNHLGRTFAKLGVSGRDELATVVGTQAAPREWPPPGEGHVRID